MRITDDEICGLAEKHGGGTHSDSISVLSFARDVIELHKQREAEDWRAALAEAMVSDCVEPPGIHEPTEQALARLVKHEVGERTELLQAELACQIERNLDLGKQIKQLEDRLMRATE
jgi:hypothetical protein